MKHIWLILAGLLASLSLTGQNLEEFQKQREAEEAQYGKQSDDFAKKREAQYEAFRKMYEAEFKRYKKNYLAYLNGEQEVLDLMASDDGISIKPLPKNKQPKGISSTVADEQGKLRKEIQYITKVTPDQLLKDLSQSDDKVQQVKDGASTLKDWNEALEKEGEKIQSQSPDIPPLQETPTPQKPQQPTPQQPTPQQPAPQQPAPQQPAPATPDDDVEIPHGKPTNYTRLSSKFGPRIHPITHKRSTHKGVDLAAPKMTPIYATADGTVAFSGRKGGYGNFVKINHENGYKTAYAHMEKIAAKQGKKIKKGDLVGYVGSTGQSTGNHLHYEVYFQDKLIDPEKTF